MLFHSFPIDPSETLVTYTIAFFFQLPSLDHSHEFDSSFFHLPCFLHYSEYIYILSLVQTIGGVPATDHGSDPSHLNSLAFQSIDHNCSLKYHLSKDSHPHDKNSYLAIFSSHAFSTYSYNLA